MTGSHPRSVPAPLVPPAVALVVGILIGRWLTLPLGLLMGLGLALGLTGGLRRGRGAGAILLAACALLGMLRVSAWRARPVDDVHRLAVAHPGAVALRGIVVDDPIEWTSPGEPARAACVLAVSRVRIGPGWERASGLVRVRADGERPALAYGDELLLEGRWGVVPGPGNPGQFDWRSALARQRIAVLVTVAGHEPLVRLATRTGSGVRRVVFGVRRRLERLLTEGFDERHAALLRSFLLGQRVALDDELRRAFIETGTMHLLVISGFNVGLVAWALELLLRLVGLGRRPRVAVAVPLLAGYCLLTGMQPPVLRATIMGWVVLGGVWLDRPVDWPNALAVAAIAILLWNPAQVMDPGFQLSFGAVMSLVAFTTPLQRRLEAWLAPIHARVRRPVTLSLASTLAVWIGLWPVLAWYFHLVSPVSVLANLVLVPLVSLLVGTGTAMLTVALGWAPILDGCGRLLAGLVDVIVGSVQACRRLPFGSWQIGHPSWGVIVGYYGLLALTIVRHRLKLAPSRVVLAWLAAVTLWLYGAVAAEALASRWLELTVLDVGHGDSLLLAAGHQAWLIDTGTRQAGEQVVVPFLRYRGIAELQALVLTHPDEDHLGGVVSVLRQIRVRRLLTNGFEPSSRTAREVLRVAAAQRTPVERLSAGMRIRGLPETDVVVLHPPSGLAPGGTTNDRSLVLSVSKGVRGFLLCGDLEDQGLPWLLQWHDWLRRAVLKVPHHGSALGPQAAAFIERVRPELAIISVGRLHGLPSAQIVELLQAADARVLLTRDAGAITVRTDGRHIQVKSFRGR